MKSLEDFIYESNLPIYEDWLKEFENDENAIFEMANLSTDQTELPMVIWIEVKRPTKHNYPRMKFLNSKDNSLLPSNLVPISIDKIDPKIQVKDVKLKISGKDLDILKKWIILNYESLMKVWNGEITATEFPNYMKKVPNN